MGIVLTFLSGVSAAVAAYFASRATGRRGRSSPRPGSLAARDASGGQLARYERLMDMVKRIVGGVHGAVAIPARADPGGGGRAQCAALPGARYLGQGGPRRSSRRAIDDCLSALWELEPLAADLA